MVSIVYGQKTIKIASYNVDNLFDLHKNGHEYREYIPYTSLNWNQKNYKTKLTNLSKVIKDIDADIIALEEVESLKALKDLQYTLKRKDLYYNYYKIAGKKNTTVKVAFLSKIPFVYAKELAVTSSYKYRNILEVKFKLGKEYLYLFIVHFKAKSGAESKRIVSAKVLVKRIKELGDDKNIIILGDFNSHYEEYKVFLKKRKHNDTHGKTAINHILKTLKQQKKASLVEYKKGEFYNLWYDVKKSQRYSYIYRRKKEVLDNFLISQSLLQKGGINYINNTFTPFDKKYLFKKKYLYRWQISRKGKKHLGKGYSDHLPVVGSFSY